MFRLANGAGVDGAGGPIAHISFYSFSRQRRWFSILRGTPKRFGMPNWSAPPVTVKDNFEHSSKVSFIFSAHIPHRRHVGPVTGSSSIGCHQFPEAGASWGVGITRPRNSERNNTHRYFIPDRIFSALETASGCFNRYATHKP